MTLLLLALLACDNAERDTPAGIDLGTDTADSARPGDCEPVRAAFDASCTSCHSGPAPQGDLDLTDPAAVVGLASAQAPSTSSPPTGPTTATSG